MLVRYVCLVLTTTSCIYAEIASGPVKATGAGGGWLDRVVAFYKNKFIEDVERTQKIQIDVTLEKAPEGYKDSAEWNETSVLRLLYLVRESAADSARPVRRALRRALRPLNARRMYYTPVDSRIMFPSLKKTDANHFYYSDTDTEERDAQGNGIKPSIEYYDSYDEDNKATGEEERFRKEKKEREKARKSVVVVRNPVEARLPSSRISIDLLRKIMEERALAARVLPTSSRVTLTWLRRYNATKKMDGTSRAPGNGTDASAAGGGGEGKHDGEPGEKGGEDKPGEDGGDPEGNDDREPGAEDAEPEAEDAEPEAEDAEPDAEGPEPEAEDAEPNAPEPTTEEPGN